MRGAHKSGPGLEIPFPMRTGHGWEKNGEEINPTSLLLPTVCFSRKKRNIHNSSLSDCFVKVQTGLKFEVEGFLSASKLKKNLTNVTETSLSNDAFFRTVCSADSKRRKKLSFSCHRLHFNFANCPVLPPSTLFFPTFLETKVGGAGFSLLTLSPPSFLHN